jgi:hypothetical protein
MTQTRQTTGRHDEGEGEQLVGVDLNKLRSIRPRELAMRFAFGAAISVIAALIGLAFNQTVGGMFLAFPAILPATVTLIEKKEGTKEATMDVEGAVAGAAGLIAFALVCIYGLRRDSAAPVLLLAFCAWAAVALIVYLAVQVPRRAAGRRGSR